MTGRKKGKQPMANPTNDVFGAPSASSPRQSSPTFQQISGSPSRPFPGWSDQPFAPPPARPTNLSATSPTRAPLLGQYDQRNIYNTGYQGPAGSADLGRGQVPYTFTSPTGDDFAAGYNPQTFPRPRPLLPAPSHAYPRAGPGAYGIASLTASSPGFRQERQPTHTLPPQRPGGDQFQSVETGADRGYISEIPVLQPPLAQLPPLTQFHFHNPQEVDNYLGVRIPFATTGTFGMPISTAEHGQYVVKLYDAMVNLKNVGDHQQNPHDVAKFQVGGMWSDPKAIEAIVHTVIGIAKMIHMYGVAGLDYKSPARPPNQDFDRSLTFPQRMFFLRFMLDHYKSHANRIMRQTRLEAYIANVGSVLLTEPSFQTWWGARSPEVQRRFLLELPYIGTSVQHPNEEGMVQLMENVRAQQASQVPGAAPTGTQAQPTARSGDSASAQQTRPAHTQSHQEQERLQRTGTLGKRPASGIAETEAGPSSKRRATVPPADNPPPPHGGQDLFGVNDTAWPSEFDEANLFADLPPLPGDTIRDIDAFLAKELGGQEAEADAFPERHFDTAETEAEGDKELNKN